MYQRDVPKILDYVKQEGPDGLLAVGAFVLSTIRTPLSRTLEQVKDIKTNGVDSKALWGNKRAGYHHLKVFRRELYRDLIENPVSASEGLYRLLAVPNLGIPKASFMLQCVGYETACLDSHNLRRFGISPELTKVSSKKPEKVMEKVVVYQGVCKKHGTSEFWWDSWCEYVAGNRYNQSLSTADKVSAFHYEVITV